MVEENAQQLQVTRVTAIMALLAEDLIRGWLDDSPVLSGQEILVRLEKFAEENFSLAEMTEDDVFSQDDCRWCLKRIVRVNEGRWTHQNGVIGCRAASFTPKDGWDESLNRRWRASPYSAHIDRIHRSTHGAR